MYTEGLSHIGNRNDIPEAFRAIYQNALPPYNVGAGTLRMFLRAVDRFPTTDTETIGDAFEHLLQDTGAQGKAGQFRTPRHIIDFIVGIINPRQDETVLDPACGTAGFLASTYQHIKRAAPTALSSIDQKTIAGNLVGYDISPDMVKLATIHMFLQHNQSPPIEIYDTVTDDANWNDHYDVILANPPFMTPTGAIKANQRFYTRANRTEVLFVDYIATHLNAEGRAGIIVPDGIVSRRENAYKQVRRMIVETSLVAVISLPGGVFNPYSPVRTSILILDRALAPETDSVGFFKVEKDGYDLGTQRRPISQNDLPAVTDEINEYLRRLRERVTMDDYEPTLGHIVEKRKIAADGDFDLNGERYYVAEAADSQWPLVRVGEVFERSTKTVTPSDIEGPVTYVGLENISQGTGHLVGNTVAENPATIKSLKNQFEHGEILYGKLRPNLNKVWLSDRSGICSTDIYVIRPKQDNIIPILYSYIFRERRFNDTVASQVKGAQHPRVGWDAIERLEIPLPPLEVQRELVSEIESYQRVIDGARQMVDGYLPHIPSNPDWETTKFDEITSAVTPTAKLTTDQFGLEGHYPIIDQSQNDVAGYTDDENSTTDAGTGMVVFGDHTCAVKFVAGKFTQGADGIKIIATKEGLDPKFLYYWMKSNPLETKGYKRHYSDLKRTTVALPPMDTQRANVAELDQEQAIIDQAERLAAKMEQRIQDALARVLKG